MNRTFREKKMDIGKRLGVSFASLLVVSIAANSYTLNSMINIGNESQEFFETSYEAVREGQSIRRDIASIHQNMACMVLDPYSTESQSLANNYVGDYVATIEGSFSSAKSSLSHLKQIAPQEMDTITKLEQSLQTFESLYIKLKETDANVNLGVANQPEESVAYQTQLQNININEILGINSSLLNSYLDVRNQSLDLYEKLELSAGQFNDSIQTELNNSMYMAAILSTSLAVLGVVLSVKITKGIKDPIEELKVAAKEMAKGNFDIDIKNTSTDELGVLSDSMRLLLNNTKGVVSDTSRVLSSVASGDFTVIPNANYVGVFKEIETSLENITEDLSNIISNIRDAADEVESASEQVSSGAHMLAQGATEQSGSIDELLLTIQDISAKINNTAKSANKANE